MRALGLAFLVAACSPPPGLTIEVVIDDPNIVKVELFAGTDCGSTCPRATVPPGLPAMRVDGAFVIKDPKPFVVDRTDFSDGVAGFRIESTQDVTLPILVALGYDTAGEIKWSWSRNWVEIPNADAEHWQIYLSPTTAIGPTFEPQAPGTERIAHWPNPQGGPMCFVLEHWGSNFLPTRELLGPANDPDCDGVSAAVECAPWIPNANGAPPTLDQVSCVTPFVHTSGATVCTLGGPECTENNTFPRDLCASIDPMYCTPSAFCQCATRLDPLPCLREQIVMGTNQSFVPFVKCAIHIDSNGKQCESSPIEIDLGPVLSGTSRKCTSIRVNDDDMALVFGQGWHLETGKLYFDGFEQPCKTDVTWEGSGMPQLVNYNVLDTEIDNGMHLLMPIRVDFKPGCDGVASTCALVPSSTTETMFQCVEEMPVMAGACAPNLDKGCQDGPYCNGECCGRGEVCGPNGCSCAGGAACVDGDACESAVVSPDQCGSVCCGFTGPCPL